MTPASFAAALAGFAALAACLALGVWLGRRRRAVVAGAAAVCLAVILFRRFLRDRPDLDDALFTSDAYTAIQEWWAIPFAIAVMGIGIPQATRAWRRVAFEVVAGLLLALAGGRLYESATGGPRGLHGRPDRDGICLQTSHYSCGAAAAATLLARIGVPADELEMARLCGTSRLGTDVLPACRGLRRKLAGTGRRVDIVRADWEALRRRRTPAMAVIAYSFLIDHWVVVLETRADAVVLADPLEGRRELTREAFLRDWRGVLVAVD